MNYFYVIGNPIKHSMSPDIHQAFAKQFDLKISYQRLEVNNTSDDNFSEAIAKCQQDNVTGCNITLPFKEKAYALANTLSSRAKLAEAANTLHFINEQIYADNTDGIGLVNDITKHQGMALQGKNILIIGAGGAVRGVLAPILDEAPKSVTIVNRTASKAIALAELFSKHYPNIVINSSDLAIVPTDNFDIIINGASTSVSGSVPDISTTIFTNCALAYDMMYSDNLTTFERFAIDNKVAKTCDGLGMLIEQAAQSFALWNKLTPDTKPVLQSFRKSKYT